MSDHTVSTIARALDGKIADLAVHLLGEPTMRERGAWRWGNKGSLKVTLAGPKAGRFKNFETGEGGDGLELIQVSLAMSKPDAIRWAEEWLGQPVTEPRRPSLEPRKLEPEPDTVAAALRIFAEAMPAKGSPVEHYLAGRRLALPPECQDIRFHSCCPRGDERLPAMVARMRSPITGEPCGAHRTFLERSPNGWGKVATGKQKMMLGNGGVVMLQPTAWTIFGLGLSEGIETGLAVIGIGWRPIWAACSAGAMRDFPVLDGVEAITVFGDHDPLDKRGNRPGSDAAMACATRWREAGREATIRIPRREGADWADIGAAA